MGLVYYVYLPTFAGFLWVYIVFPPKGNMFAPEK